jgi:L,D-transpeptidase catalytic domain
MSWFQLGPVRTLSTGLVATALLLLGASAASAPSTRAKGAPRHPLAISVTHPKPQPLLRAAPPPANLPVIDYGPAPRGFPADPTPMSGVALIEGMHPTGRVAGYDAPGGRPRAFLDPTILGAPITLPIVLRHRGWVGVLLPSVNRTIAWVPPGSWVTVALRDQIVVVRSAHQVSWYRDGALMHSWLATLGSRATPTPLGRTFILGRSTLRGHVYADTDVFALGAVPDDPNAVPTGLKGAHIGLHTWYHDADLGKNTTDGCIRVTRTGQRLLLAELLPGTEVLVVDKVTVAASPSG